MTHKINPTRPDGWEGLYLLDCRHVFGDDEELCYYMYCDLLKPIPRGGARVRVYGNRWRTTKGERIVYVDSYRVLDASVMRGAEFLDTTKGTKK